MPEDRPTHQIIEIFGALADVLPYTQPVYRRTVHARPVTFTCQWCNRTVTQQRFPGPLPRYCGDACRIPAQRTGTRARVQRFRARHGDAEQDHDAS